MTGSSKVNVLVYSGNGSTVESVRHAVWSLRRLLSPNYAVIPVNGEAIIKEPWIATCALLVFPGGADLGYCRTLNGEGNRRIIQYVNAGGAFLGLCAGAYYGSQRCEFEVGDKRMEVVGDRELAFYPGICRGLAFPGFVYHSEKGAKAVELKVNKSALVKQADPLSDSFRVYYNGGGAFVDADKLAERGVEVLASFTEDLKVDTGPVKAAVVYRKAGEGHVVLTGPHPEFAAVNLHKQDGGETYAKVVEAIAADDKPRAAFLKACLLKLGLNINEHEQSVPSLSRLHLSSQHASDVSELVSSWADIISLDDGEEYIKAENDTFHLEKPSRWSMGTLSRVVGSIASALEGVTEDSKADDGDGDGDRIILDYNKVVKRLVAHETDLPTNKETPNFNHHAYFANLRHYQTKTKGIEGEFGKYLMYGEVVTSTNTLLEKNNKFLNSLPSGFTASATTQIAGRGRGSNVWVSPPGALIYSVVLRHSMQLTQSAPVVFVQYLAGLAAIIGIHTYEPGYQDLDIKLKWPNDIYAADPGSASNGNARNGSTKKNYVKIGGVLVNSSYAGADYTLVVGVGINLANAAPTTSINALARAKGLPLVQTEKLLARILTSFEQLYNKFVREGWSRDIEDMYYRNWLHRQIVTIDTEGGARARIKGITRDWGMLLAEELGWEDRRTGKVWQLQSDSNSFDFFKGLLKRKA
ncbi:class II aaRS and biotin synthetase [Rhizodiscina lignyota]|uniref:Class II aaRS and biotin synthetase n=1 Tax=Rhizodiscina lignyota TaxID=1504668 RepID=A0A9P4IDN4_9PEZI|nr:class II aaRS and biotin synthetase [Rhizodiscina lignyota]